MFVCAVSVGFSSHSGLCCFLLEKLLLGFLVRFEKKKMSLILRRVEETFSLFLSCLSLENGSSPFYPGRHQSKFCIDIY